jgi:simple sugar transport system permease protein
MAFVPALLKQFKNADVLLTSFLVSAATIPLIDALIAGKFRDVSGNLLATPLIAAKFQFTRLLEPSSLNTSVIPALILCAGMWYYLFRTASGRRLTIWGKAPEFAAYSGYSETRVVCFSLLGSGALHGLTGFFAVCGTYYSCQSGFYSGMGWNALSCALIAQSNPAALVPVGLIISWLYTGASRVSLTQNFGFDISSLIQGIVLFFISAHFISRKSKSGIGRQTEKKS